MNDKTLREYLLLLLKAKDFYNQAPDGQYDAFVYEVLNAEAAKISLLIANQEHIQP